MKKIVVSITREPNDVSIRIDTQGFPGETCLLEIEKLKKKLADLGLQLEVDKIQMKNIVQIANELGTNVEDVIRFRNLEEENELEEGC